MPRALLLSFLLATSALVTAQEQQRVEYLVDSVDFDSHFGTSTDPDFEPGLPDNKMTVHTNMVHNFSKPILFLAVEMTGYAEDGNEISLSPVDVYSPEQREAAPLHARQTMRMAATWFEEPWPAHKRQTVPLIVSTNLAILKNQLYSIGYSSYAIGHAPTDALRLLGDPLIPPVTRRELAVNLSRAVGRSYRYLNAQEIWAVPEELGSTSPVAPPEEQVTSKILKDVSAIESAPEIVVSNDTDRHIYVGVAGNGKRVWWDVNPGERGMIDLTSGLSALTIWDQGYQTHTVLVREGRQYALDIQP